MDQADSRGLGLVAGLATLALAAIAVLLPELDWAPRARMVGWLLFLAGLAELAFGYGRADSIRTTALASGAVTAAAGLLFILRPVAPYFPVTNLVMLWLLVRGGWVLGRATRHSERGSFGWLAVSGGMDLLLGLLLASGLPIAMLVVTLFGPTAPIVASFSLVLAASLAVTGAAEVALSRRPASPPDA